jgi:membrane protease YdiL (CAAX protease family)
MFSPLVQNAITGFKSTFFNNLGFTMATTAPWYSWLLALAVAICYILYTFNVLPIVRELQKEISMFKLLGLFAGFVAGIIEELVFRRWLMDLAMNHGIGILAQIVISGSLFGFAHISWGGLRKNRMFALKVIFSTTVLGLFLSIVYVIGQRNIGPCIAAHCLISMTIEPWLMLAAVSGKRSSIELKE